MWNFVGVAIAILLYVGDHRPEYFWHTVVVAVLITVWALFTSPPEGLLGVGIGAVIVLLTKLVPGVIDDVLLLMISNAIVAFPILKRPPVIIGTALVITSITIYISGAWQLLF